jgi:hypothetical protein
LQPANSAPLRMISNLFRIGLRSGCPYLDIQVYVAADRCEINLGF